MKLFGANAVRPAMPEPAEAPVKAKRRKKGPGEETSFARRVRPKTRPAETKWEVIKSTFKLKIAPTLDEIHQYKSVWEDCTYFKLARAIIYVYIQII